MDKTQEYLSQEKYEELSKELELLKLVKRREVAERLESAKALGDLAENAEYHAAREEQSEVEERINQLEHILKSSVIITGHHSTKVEIGTILVVKQVGAKEEQRYMVVGSEEADIAAGKISHQSPLGSALLGHKQGDKVEVKAPKGIVHYQIISLE